MALPRPLAVIKGRERGERKERVRNREGGVGLGLGMDGKA